MSKKSRITLKEYFKAGEMPTEEDFKDMIDSTLNRVDDDIEVITEDGEKRFGIGTSVPEASLHVNGNFKLEEGVSVNRITHGGHLSANNSDTLVTESAIAQFTGTITPPVGTILPWFPGCYGPGESGEFHDLTDQIALADNWRVCDGTEVDDPESPFHGKKLPLLTNDNFLMGASQHGDSGGSNDGSHSHKMKKHSHKFNLTADYENDDDGHRGHNHHYDDYYRTPNFYRISDSGNNAWSVNGSSGQSTRRITHRGAHRHKIIGSVGSGTNLDNNDITTYDETLDNRPSFLSVKYIIRIK